MKRIIHRDIKADNILLTEDYEPQVHVEFQTENGQPLNLLEDLDIVSLVMHFHQMNID